jgi:hypothetical protein
MRSYGEADNADSVGGHTLLESCFLHRYDKIQFDCVARNVTELDRDDGESLARSDEELQSQDAGFNLPLWRKVLESLPASAL